MNIFAKFGELILKLFDLMGMVILEIPKIPDKLRGIDTENLKDKIDTEKIKENITKIKNDVNFEDKLSKISKTEPMSSKETAEIVIVNEKERTRVQGVHKHDDVFTSEEKEKTVFRLQIVSGTFLVVSIAYLFNFISFGIYGILGVLLVIYILYILFTKVKLMYNADFNAYRDFFLMYIAVGVIIVLVGGNPNFVMAFSFQSLPSLTILIFAIISTLAVFLIFRIRYRRNYTYGIVLETGKKTAYVKVDYDICSNVKPDIYIVDNSYGADEGEKVKLQIEEKLLSNSGNKPVSIIEIIK